MSMATHNNNIVSLSFAFILFLVSSDGRSLLQQNLVSKSTDPLSSSEYVRASLATSSYTGKTNYNDVLGLVALCTRYTWLRGANEDPCLSPRWSWIQCNSEENPRITELHLSGGVLYGVLPDFSSMDALQIIDLSHNILTGLIPSFLGTFADLQQLNLAYNVFSGLVPVSLCRKNLELSLDGNLNLYTSGSCSLSGTPISTTPYGSIPSTPISTTPYGTTPTKPYGTTPSTTPISTKPYGTTPSTTPISTKPYGTTPSTTPISTKPYGTTPITPISTTPYGKSPPGTPMSIKPYSTIPAASGTTYKPTISIPSRKKSSNVPAVAGSTTLVFVVFSIAVGIFARHRHKARVAAAIAEASTALAAAGDVMAIAAPTILS